MNNNTTTTNNTIQKIFDFFSTGVYYCNGCNMYHDGLGYISWTAVCDGKFSGDRLCKLCKIFKN